MVKPHRTSKAIFIWRQASLKPPVIARWGLCTLTFVYPAPSHGVLDVQNLLPECQDLCAQPKKLAIIHYYSRRVSLEILFSCSILLGINFLAGGKFLPARGDKTSPWDTLPMDLLQHIGEEVWSCIPISRFTREEAIVTPEDRGSATSLFCIAYLPSSLHCPHLQKGCQNQPPLLLPSILPSCVAMRH